MLNRIFSQLYNNKYFYNYNILYYTINKRNKNSHKPSRYHGRQKKKMKEYLDWLHAFRDRQSKRRSLISDSISVDERYALPLEECIKRVLSFSRLTYDETVEFQVNLNLDPRKGPEYIRGNIVLPFGSGKQRRICVFCPSEYYESLKELNVDIIGDEKLLNEIGQGIDPKFDVIISTPDQLKRLIPYGRQLGPKGLMPNPKMGTLTTDPIKAIKEAKQGQIPVKLLTSGVIAGPVGKVSFGNEKILKNINSFIIQLRDNLRPVGAKKQYFIKAYLSSSQGRSYQILVNNYSPWIRLRE